MNGMADIRLNKIIRQFNIGLDDLVNFLKGQGVEVDANPNAKLIYSEDDIKEEWLDGVNTIGICGATSTPRWLMTNVKRRIEQMLGQ